MPERQGNVRNKEKSRQRKERNPISLMPNTHRGKLFLSPLLSLLLWHSSCLSKVKAWYHRETRLGCSLTHLHLPALLLLPTRPSHHCFNITLSLLRERKLPLTTPMCSMPCYLESQERRWLQIICLITNTEDLKWKRAIYQFIQLTTIICFEGENKLMNLIWLISSHIPAQGDTRCIEVCSI